MQIHHRRSIRLKNYDYSQSGAYFITICAHNKQYLFGDIVNSEMQLNERGKCVLRTWEDLPNHNINMKLGTFQIMPNHIHGIIILNNVGAGSKPAQNHTNARQNKRAGYESITKNTDIGANNQAGYESIPNNTDIGANNRAGLEPAPTNQKLSEIVRQLKTFSAKHINKIRGSAGTPVWQRNYYEHIIRNEQSYIKISEYIMYNPMNWENDELYII